MIQEQKQKCSNVPLKVKKNMAFIIDVRKLKHWEDFKSDMNGVYPHPLRIATWTVDIDENRDVEVIEKRKVALDGKSHFHLQVNSKSNKAGLCRSIFLLKAGKNDDVINGQCLLQYTIKKQKL